MFQFVKRCYGTTVSLTQLSSNKHLNTANSACCKSLLYITRCPNFAMWRCLYYIVKNAWLVNCFSCITRHFDNNDTHSVAPSSYVPEFIEDNTTEIETELLVTVCNVSGVYAFLLLQTSSLLPPWVEWIRHSVFRLQNSDTNGLLQNGQALGLYDRASRRLLMNETNRCTVNFQCLLMAQ